MTTIALFGAGGKMGYRLARNLLKSDYKVLHVEPSPAGRERVKKDLGVDCVDQDVALAKADVVVLATPDTLIGKISHQIAPSLKAGTMLIILDAAAPFAGHLPDRKDLTYFITHPCHPIIFASEAKEEVIKDHFGGIAASQSIVNSLMQGPERDYAVGEAIARTIWAPILRSHRVTVEQMALLEPGLSETIGATLVAIMREAMDEVVARGVDPVTARDFLLGHLNILMAVTFNEIPGAFSDACNKAIEFGKPALMRSDWKRVFEPEEIAASIRRIT
ncbi:MAG: phosphogluconate dehydrogenase C-terminal domain-containing protein [Ancalomicrobiaceae bacterium]|nr:phosphogluconate dehydrogenase C-terminal domain-containing protein [Ancalomicrobiaceae bacterium]